MVVRVFSETLVFVKSARPAANSPVTHWSPNKTQWVICPHLVMTLITPQIILFSLLQLNTLATPKNLCLKSTWHQELPPTKWCLPPVMPLGVLQGDGVWLCLWLATLECRAGSRHWRRLLISHTQIAQVCFTVETGIHDSSLGIREEVTWDSGFVCQLPLCLLRPKSGWIRSFMNHPNSIKCEQY